jgi:hypothetical protein
MTTSDLIIKWRTPALIVAYVRDPVAGVVEVRWTGGGAGWHCTCPEYSCHHIAAVRTVTAEKVV